MKRERLKRHNDDDDDDSTNDIGNPKVILDMLRN